MTIQEALKDLGCPVCHPPYRGAERKYVEYMLLGQSGVLYAEGTEQETNVNYMLNVCAFSAEVIALALAAKKSLENAGYIVVMDTEIYEKEAKLHRIIMTARIEGAVYC